jgi:hypothetical protein
MSSIIARLADLYFVLRTMSASCSLGHRVQSSGVAIMDVILVQFMNSFRQIMDLEFVIALCYVLQHVLHTVKWIKTHLLHDFSLSLRGNTKIPEP